MPPFKSLLPQPSSAKAGTSSFKWPWKVFPVPFITISKSLNQRWANHAHCSHLLAEISLSSINLPPSAVILLASKILLRHIRRPRPVWRHPYPLSAEWPWDGISWWILDLDFKLFWKYTCLQKSLLRKLSSDFNMNEGFFYQKTLELPYTCLKRGSFKLFL